MPGIERAYRGRVNMLKRIFGSDDDPPPGKATAGPATPERVRAIFKAMGAK